MATHCSIAWETPWTEEPARLQFMGLQRVGHDCVTNTNMHVIKFYTRTQDKSRNLMGSRARPPFSSWQVSGQVGVAAAHHGDIDPGGSHTGEVPSVTWTCLLVATIWGPSL